MKAEFCKRINCQFFGKFSGKACCRAQHPKRFLKHLERCPQTIICEARVPIYETDKIKHITVYADGHYETR